MAAEILVGEAARILNCSTNHVRYLERTGQVRARRIGNVRVFLRTEVQRVADERYRRATGQPHWRVEDGSQEAPS